MTSAIFLIGISVPLGLLVLLGSPPALYGLHRLAAPLHRSSHVEQARAAEAAGVATDLVRGGRVLKGIGAEAAAATRYRAVSAASLRASVRAAAAGNVLEAANVLAGGLLLALVALVGGRLAASRRHQRGRAGRRGRADPVPDRPAAARGVGGGHVRRVAGVGRARRDGAGGAAGGRGR